MRLHTRVRDAGARVSKRRPMQDEVIPEPAGAADRPPRGPRPPAPPGVGDPGRGEPDPADPGPPIPVALGPLGLGDLGHPRVDARLLRAILLRDGRVGRWLRERGIDDDAVEDAFPGTGWPLEPDA